MTKTNAKKPVFDSWDAVNGALTQLSRLESEVARLQGRLDGGIAKLQQRYTPEIEPLQKEIKVLGEAVLDHVDDHRADLSEDGDRRSRYLAAGRVGLYLAKARLATMSKVTWDKVLDRIGELPARLRSKLIRTKEAPDKDAIKDAIESGEISEEQRRALGVSIIQDEKAFYELT